MKLLFLLLAFLSIASVQASDVLMVKEETGNIPVKVVSIEAAPGSWWDEGELLYTRSGSGPDINTITWGPEEASRPDAFPATKSGIVVVGFQADRLLAVSNVTMAVEFKDSLGKTQQGPEDYIYDFFNTCSVCLDDRGMNRAPQDLSNPNGRLEKGKTYYATFLYPENTSGMGYEVNHIAITIDGVAGGVWVYHSSGDIPNQGTSWMPRGINSAEGDSKLNKVNGGWMISH